MTAPHFKLSARPTRGGWRGVASLGNDVVALKTIPIFRDKSDALAAIRAWATKHGAHADRLLNPKNPKGTSRQSRQDATDRLREFLLKRGATPAEATKEIRKLQSGTWASRRISYEQRKHIPRKFFALPERAPGPGSLPLSNPEGTKLDPKHAANAAARLSMMRRLGHVTPAEYNRARLAIMRAACKVGVERTCAARLGNKRLA